MYASRSFEEQIHESRRESLRAARIFFPPVIECSDNVTFVELAYYNSFDPSNHQFMRAGKWLDAGASEARSRLGH